MKCLILYSSLNPGPDREPLEVHGGGRIWIRSERVESPDLPEALDLASPADDETVLNTIPAPSVD